VAGSLAILVMVGGAALPAQAPNGANLQVYLMTMGPGAAIYERFDHNAIWVRDSATHTDLIYNYGTFEFPITTGGMLGFVADFAMGRPRYWLGVDSSLSDVLQQYTYFHRDVDVQLLNLTPSQRADIATRLAVNALPANRTYVYDYFRDNCSTRVRDLLDAVLGGALRRATVGKPAEGTLRFHTLRSITNDKLLFFGIDAALGPSVDRPLDQWGEMFLPGKVQQRVRELRVAGADGNDAPLVVREERLLTIGIYHVESAPPRWTLVLLIAGLAIALVVGLAMVRGSPGIVGHIVGSAWLLLMGAGGLLLVFFWAISHNVATFANHNLLVISPLALLLIGPFWSAEEGHTARWSGGVARVLIGTVVAAIILALVPGIAGQETLPVVVLTAPATLVAAWAVVRGAARVHK
jgi:uncharacterized membrane protein